MRRNEVEGLDVRRTWWVAAVVAPIRDWSAFPGCRRGARFMVDRDTLKPSRDEFGAFDSRLGCLTWIMENRQALNRALPGAAVRAVRLDRWLLGLE